MSIKSNETGKKGEEIAAKLLEQKGFKIIERNYRYGKGEIDIIAEDLENDCFVFVEVKSRETLLLGPPEYAITKNKIKQVRKIAELYLFEKEIKDKNCRFDVVTVLFCTNGDPIVEYYRNAFF
jgi:putative endonuclease